MRHSLYSEETCPLPFQTQDMVYMLKRHAPPFLNSVGFRIVNLWADVLSIHYQAPHMQLV